MAGGSVLAMVAAVEETLVLIVAWVLAHEEVSLTFHPQRCIASHLNVGYTYSLTSHPLENIRRSATRTALYGAAPSAKCVRKFQRESVAARISGATAHSANGGAAA